MKQIFNLRTVLLTAIIALLGGTGTSLLAVNIAPGGNYSQSFDGIGSSATATLPDGWKIENITTERTVSSAYAGLSNTTTYALNAGTAMSSSAANGKYNFAGSSATDRAVGGISSSNGSKSINMFLKLTNSGSTSINSFNISYDAERYRNGNNDEGFSIRLYFSTTGEANSWTEIPNFIATFNRNYDNNGSTSNPMETINISDTFNQTIVAGSDIYFAWSYSVTRGARTTEAQAVGIDNISITAVNGGTTPTINVNPSNLSTFSTVVGDSVISGNIVVTGANLTQNITVSIIGNNPSMFIPSVTSITPNGPTTMTVKYKPTAAGVHNAILRFSSNGATTVNVSLAGVAQGPATIAMGGTYSQAFDYIGSGAEATLPPCWKVETDTILSHINSAYSAVTTNTTQHALTYNQAMSASATGGIYNFGGSSATDRAVGGLLSETGDVRSINVMLKLQNTGSQNINNFTVSYDAEKYRNGTNPQYATIITYYSYTGAEGSWQEAPMLGVAFPGGDPNNEGSTTNPMQTVQVSNILNQSLVAGQSIYLAWNISTYGATAVNAKALGIDNVVIKANGTTSPTIFITPPLIDPFSTSVGTPIASRYIKVNSVNLTQNITASILGADSLMFSVSKTSITRNVLDSIRVTYNPTAVGNHTARLVLTSNGANTITIPLSGYASAAATISTGTPYTQNFNGIGISALATLPPSWKMENIMGARSISSAYSTVTTTTTNRVLEYNIAMEEEATHGRYNFAGSAENDRAIGGLSSGTGSQTVNMFLQLTNTGAAAISKFHIGYNAERYRNGSNEAGFSIRFYYSTTGAANSWTEVSGLQASFDKNDDNLGSIPNPLETKAVAGAVGQTLAAGGKIYFAWSYSVTSGESTSNAQAIGIDDIIIMGIPARSGQNIFVHPTTLPVLITNAGSSITSQQILVGGSGLYANISIGTNSNLFTPSITSIPYNEVKLVTVTYSPTAVGTHTASLNFTSPGATTVTITLNGNARQAAGITSATAYTQNFNEMGSGSVALLPPSWKVEKSVDVRDATSSYSSITGLYTDFDLATGVEMSSTAQSGVYNFAGTATDRALGGLTGGTSPKTINMLLQLKNTGTDSIHAFDIEYYAERYRNGSNPAGFSVRFYYSTTGAADSWVEAGNLNTSFTPNADNNGASSHPMEIKVVNSVLNQALAAGQTIYFGWSYSASTGTNTANAQAIGIDNVTITATTPTPLILVEPSILPRMISTVGATVTSQNIFVSGELLTNDITVSVNGANSTMFSPSVTTIDKDTPTEITVSYTPTTAGNHTANLVFSSNGVTPVTIPLTGTAADGATISTAVNYTQNFDTISSSAEATLPVGWKMQNISGARNINAASYANIATNTTQYALVYNQAMSSSAANGRYNFGGGSETDRAIGGISSGSASQTINMLLQLSNIGSDTIKSLEIGYSAERYRNGTNAAGFSVLCYYSGTGTANSWIPVSDGGVSFTPNANNNGSTTNPVETKYGDGTIDIEIAPGATFYLAWSYSVTSGSTTSNAQAIGIDDITITASGTTVATPEILVSPAKTISCFNSTALNGKSTSSPLSIGCLNLKENIEAHIVGTNANMFKASFTSTPKHGVVPITVTYTPKTNGNHSAKLILSSLGAADVIIPLCGTCSSGGGTEAVLTEADGYFQDFNSIGSSATAALPVSWKIEKVNQVRSVTSAFSGLANTTEYTKATGSAYIPDNSPAGMYNFCSSADSYERAIGGFASDTQAKSVNMFLKLKNGTSHNINSLLVMYDVERYKRGTNSAGFSMRFYYSTTGAANSWTEITACKRLFVASCPTCPDVVTMVDMISTPVTSGSYIYYAWSYSVDSGTNTANAQALGIDNVFFYYQPNGNYNLQALPGLRSAAISQAEENTESVASPKLVESISEPAILISSGKGFINVNLPADANIQVVSMQGATVKALKGTKGLNTINLPQGVYVVKASDTVTKVMVY